MADVVALELVVELEADEVDDPEVVLVGSDTVIVDVGSEIEIEVDNEVERDVGREIVIEVDPDVLLVLEVALPELALPVADEEPDFEVVKVLPVAELEGTDAVAVPELLLLMVEDPDFELEVP